MSDGSRTVNYWINKGIDLDVNKKKREVILKTHRNLIAKPQDGGTPRDTGRAAMGWVSTVGAPTAYIPPEGGGSIPTRTTMPPAAGMRIEQDMFETNLVPYIGRLNEGHSRQASSGFIPAAAEKAIRQSGGQI